MSWFRDLTTKSRINLRNSLLIYKKDTASQMLTKIQFFKNYVQSNETLSLPLQFNTRVLPTIPQLAIIFRATSKTNKSGNYTLHIPHYSGNKTPRISSHTKGNYWAKYTCRDNSSILVYCNTKAEAIKIAKQMNHYVERKYKSAQLNPSTGYMEHEPNKIVKVKPVRADYFPTGKQNNPYPEWRYNFK